jgi:hypothetical protein
LLGRLWLFPLVMARLVQATYRGAPWNGWP